MKRYLGILTASIMTVAALGSCSSNAVFTRLSPTAPPTISDTRAPVAKTDYVSNLSPTSAYNANSTGTGTGTGTGTATPSTAPSSLTPKDEPTIVIGADGVFDPASLTVKAGTEVSFLNEDCCNWHTINCDFPFSKKMEASGTARFTFTKPGKYIFWLDQTQWVYGTITVS
jgi:plastocyanin